MPMHVSFVDAMDHAQKNFGELHDVHAGYEWLDKAATYATTQQQAEIDLYVFYADYVESMGN